ncbi:5-formyltetrahydrofolate cyclo-ligase [Thiorhodospira sibirica]|uniref:5-formyltetrahydrofolate cyclo-ligase n=1 Tax=Thiorhodospira sibirica TaxID=154347 RepID=UPI001FE80C0C|nr:5-formyltetrahydrofolate cyclo-ligase [Thiorhodospira sibirica]
MTVSPDILDLVTLRRDLRRQRAMLSRAAQAQAAERIARQLIHCRWFRAARHIAAYLPHRGEVDPMLMVDTARLAGKRLYLPRIHPHHPRCMDFLPWTPQTRLSPNRFGILEPHGVRVDTIPITRLDLVLTPLLGFDRQGRRLGMGGGYYDASFAFLRQRRHWHKPYLVGLAYEFQGLEALPSRPWDIPLTAVITERRLYSFCARHGTVHPVMIFPDEPA